MAKNLRQKATSAFFWDMLNIFTKHGIAFVVSIFLARLLLPAEFGLVAMALVFISITQVFADFGLASALIQRNDNTSITYSSVFYFNVSVGILLFLLFWISAPVIGRFYGNETIVVLVRFLSFDFILSSFNQVQHAILRKNIEFKTIATRAAIAQTSSGIVAIVLAYNEAGVYALVAQNLLGSLIGTFLLWRVTEWRPGLEFSFGEIRKLTGFGLYVLFNNATARIASQIDTLVIGKVFSANTLGLYSRAASLTSLVTVFSSSSISRIAFSLLSHLQDEKNKFINTYFVMLELVAFAAFCLSGALILSGSDIIVILFGEQWTSSIFIFQILVLKSFTYPIALLIVSVFLAAGKSKESFWYGNVIRVLSLAPLVFAIFLGFQPFLYAVVGFSIINWVLTNWFVSITFGISFLHQCTTVGLYFALFLILGLIFFGVNHFFEINFPFSGLAQGAVFAGIYIATNWLLKTRGFEHSLENFTPMWRWAYKKLIADN